MAREKFKRGQQAPEFTATDVKGNTIRLSDYSKKSVLLVFFRYAGCPWCNLAIHRLALEYPMLKKENCEVIAFVQSDKKSIDENIYGRHEVKPRFPIVADPDKEFYSLYGVHSSVKAGIKSVRVIPQWIHAVRKHGFKQKGIDGDLFLVPASFLVASRTQKIVKADYGTSFYEFESFFNIYELLTFKQA
jgi:peroxiredoxin Q/BCP